MAVDVSALEPYQKSLYDFLNALPEGAASVTPSGEPAMPNMTRAAYDALDKTTIVNNKLFAQLTGVTHAALLERWTFNPTFTTCNSLLSSCATAMGVHGFIGLDNPGGKATASVNIGNFEIATALASVGMSHAWVPNANGARPRYGDIFRADEYHMGLSLGFDGDSWASVEAGQGGRALGFDRLARKTEGWGARGILGWVDVKSLLAERTMAPYWLGGWWRVREDKEWHYYFENDGRVFCQTQPPASTLLPPPFRTGFAGAYEIKRGKFQTVEVRWFDSDADETFQVVTTRDNVAGTKIRDAGKDRLAGTTFGGKTMTGFRLPGPIATGLSYAESHPHGGSGDSRASR